MRSSAPTCVGFFPPFLNPCRTSLFYYDMQKRTPFISEQNSLFYMFNCSFFAVVRLAIFNYTPGKSYLKKKTQHILIAKTFIILKQPRKFRKKKLSITLLFFPQAVLIAVKTSFVKFLKLFALCNSKENKPQLKQEKIKNLSF